MDKFLCFPQTKTWNIPYMDYIHGTFLKSFLKLISLIDKKGKDDMFRNFISDKVSFRTKLEATLDFL